MIKKKSFLKRNGKSIGFNIVMFILSCIVLIPFYYLIVTTFKTAPEAAAAPLALPQSLNFDNYVNAFIEMDYLKVLLNDVIIYALSLLLCMALSAFAAYPIARRRKKIDMIVLAVIMVGMMIPMQINIIPLFQIIRDMGIMDTLAAVIVLYSVAYMPFAVFVFVGFMRGIPKELEEAARLDGCNVFQTFWHIILPLIKPATITIIILTGLNIWNDFMMRLYFLQSPENSTILKEVYQNVGQFTTDWATLFPMLVLGMLPMFIVYLVMQRKFVEGVAAGAVKG